MFRKDSDMPIVKSLEAAKEWFLRHPNSSVRCVKDSRVKVCRDLAEAAAWYGGDHGDS